MLSSHYIRLLTIAVLRFTSISAGRDHLVALTSQGRTFALPISLSANTYGQLGFRKFTLPDSTAANPPTTPRIPIELTPRVLEDPHALATPFVRSGQVGSPTHVEPGIGFCDMLFEVPALKGLRVAQAVAGDRCTYARTEEGRVLAWGANSFGYVHICYFEMVLMRRLFQTVGARRHSNYRGGNNSQRSDLRSQLSWWNQHAVYQHCYWWVQLFIAYLYI